MTLHQLRVVVKVAELQSFTEAAKALGLSQPSVSSLIQGLVNELKYKLFERRGVKILLTPEGTVFLRRAREALAVLEGTQDEIDEVHGLKKGKIRVGGSALAAATFLPVAVQKFKKENPGIEVTLKIQMSTNLEKKLLDGELDVAILGWPPRSVHLIGEPYRDEEIVAIAPPDHPLAQKRYVPLKLIAKEPLITEEKATRIRDMVERQFAAKGLPFVAALEVDVQFGSRDAIRSAVANGLGIGFLSKSHVVQDVAAGRLRVLKIPELKLKRTMYIALHKSRQSGRLVRTFIDFLKRTKD